MRFQTGNTAAKRRETCPECGGEYLPDENSHKSCGSCIIDAAIEKAGGSARWTLHALGYPDVGTWLAGGEVVR